MKYLLIDGNNLAIRSAFANESMRSDSGEPTGAHYGFFNSLLNLKEKFKDHQFLVVWDGKSKRRMNESISATQKQIIPSEYKSNRQKDDLPKPLRDWYAQGDYLKRALGATGIPQIRLDDYEADDVIASYCHLLKDSNLVVIVTSDRDFYQLLDDNVTIWDGMKNKYVTKSSLFEDEGITPEQHVHVGALMGDVGDNIHGIPGWGEKTAIAEIKKYGTYQGVLDSIVKRYSKEINLYPKFEDVPGNLFEEYMRFTTDKGTYLYPQIYSDMPYLGLLDAFHNKKIKISKRELMALLFSERVALAYSLKKMDCEISDLPEICSGKQCKDKLFEYFKYYNITNIVMKSEVLFSV